MNFSKYRIKPGSKVDLRQWDPDDRSASPGSKEEDRKRLAELAVRLDELQDILYAERKRSVLVVLQGMDTSGKDGTIRHVFSEVDPLGVRAVRFKVPTEEELARSSMARTHAPGKGGRDLQPQPLRRCARGARPPVDARPSASGAMPRSAISSGCWRRARRSSPRSTCTSRKASRRSGSGAPRRSEQRGFSPADFERKLWPQYMKAYAAALDATSTDQAPWYVVPANSKTNRNLLISSVLLDTLEGLKMRYPPPTEKLDGIVIE